MLHKDITNKLMPIILGKDKENYSIVQNPDVEIVKEIKNYEVPKDLKSLSDGTKFLQFMGEDEVIIIGTGWDSGKRIIPLKEWEKMLVEEKLYLINQKFSAHKLFTKAFLPLIPPTGKVLIRICKHDEAFAYPEGTTKEQIEQANAWATPDRCADPLYTFYQTGTIDFDGNITPDDGMSIVGFYLDTDGNFRMRDYNLDISKFINDKPRETKEEYLLRVVKYMEDRLANHNKYSYNGEYIKFESEFKLKDDILFHENFAIQLIKYGFNFLPRKINGKYGRRGRSENFVPGKKVKLLSAKEAEQYFLHNEYLEI